MKKAILIIFFLLSKLSIGENVKTVKIVMTYVDYDLCTIVPLNENSVLRNKDSKEMLISQDFYRHIQEQVRKKRAVRYLHFSGDFDLSFLDDEDFRKKDGTEPHKSEKIKIDDSYLDVRFVINFKDGYNEEKLLIGRSKNMIGMNNKFYQLSEDNFDKLLSMLRSLIE